MLDGSSSKAASSKRQQKLQPVSIHSQYVGKQQHLSVSLDAGFFCNCCFEGFGKSSRTQNGGGGAGLNPATALLWKGVVEWGCHGLDGILLQVLNQEFQRTLSGCYSFGHLQYFGSCSFLGLYFGG